MEDGKQATEGQRLLAATAVGTAAMTAGEPCRAENFQVFRELWRDLGGKAPQSSVGRRSLWSTKMGL